MIWVIAPLFVTGCLSAPTASSTSSSTSSSSSSSTGPNGVVYSVTQITSTSGIPNITALGNITSSFLSAEKTAADIKNQTDQAIAAMQMPKLSFPPIPSPSMMFGSMQTPNSMFGGMQTPSSMFGGMQTPNSMFGGMQTTNSMFGGVQTPNSMFGGMQTPNSMFGGMSSPNLMFGGMQTQNQMFGAMPTAAPFSFVNKISSIGKAIKTTNSALRHKVKQSLVPMQSMFQPVNFFQPIPSFNLGFF